MMTRRFHRFAYPLTDRADRAHYLHTLRDGDAFIEVGSVLSECGSIFDKTFLNLPGDPRLDGSPEFLNSLGADDLLVLATRPPLRDGQKKAKNAVPKSGVQTNVVRKAVPLGKTMMERAILEALRPCFGFCDRSRISLAKGLARQLPCGFEDRATIHFTQYLRRSPVGADAAYKFLEAEDEGHEHRPPMPHRTAGFLIRTALWHGGPWVLNVFGMSGNQGLIWAHLLRTRYPDLLAGSGPMFFMCEIILEDIPPRPLTLKFCEAWECTPLLRTQDIPRVPATKRCPARTCARARAREHAGERATRGQRRPGAVAAPASG